MTTTLSTTKLILTAQAHELSLHTIAVFRYIELISESAGLA